MSKSGIFVSGGGRVGSAAVSGGGTIKVSGDAQIGHASIGGGPHSSVDVSDRGRIGGLNVTPAGQPPVAVNYGFNPFAGQRGPVAVNYGPVAGGFDPFASDDEDENFAAAMRESERAQREAANEARRAARDAEARYYMPGYAGAAPAPAQGGITLTSGGKTVHYSGNVGAISAGEGSSAYDSNGNSFAFGKNAKDNRPK